MQTGAIILCGGRSTRMGRDKATLPFGPETLLRRVVRLLSEVVEPANTVVVAAVDQTLPSLPSAVAIVRDEYPNRGPLEGLAVGLRALTGRADAAYVTSCDVPLLAPRFVERMFELLGDYEIAVPRDAEFHHSLAAVYRPSVIPAIERLLAADRRSVRSLFEEVQTREVAIDELREADPQLATLENLNEPEDYRRALAAAGYPIESHL